jgi:ABC-type amino acid transport system permease subunit
VTLAVIAVLVAVVLGLIFASFRLAKKAGAAEERADHEAHERERSERMAHEMLKERTREDTVRDLDDGTF